MGLVESMVRFDRENLLLKSLITWQEAPGIDGLEALEHVCRK